MKKKMKLFSGPLFEKGPWKEERMKKQYITAQELAQVLDISMSNAYVRIREMNDELKKQNYQIIQGRIPIAYAQQKFMGIDFEEVI